MENDIEQSLNWLLIRASIPAKQTIMRAGELFGLTSMQLFALGLINKDGQTSMHDVTVALGCDASNVTGIVEKLVSSELVGRTESPRDRRIKLLSLTKKGKLTHERIMKELENPAINLLINLTDEEKTTLGALLNKVLENCNCSKDK